MTSSTSLKRKPLADFPAFAREGLCTVIVLRQLGFTAEEVFFSAVNDGSQDAFVVLRAQGREVAIRVGEASEDTGLSFDAWNDIVVANNAGAFTDSEMALAYERSRVRSMAVGLITKLSLAGFSFPSTQANMPHGGVA